MPRHIVNVPFDRAPTDRNPPIAHLSHRKKGLRLLDAKIGRVP
jgi:hypothetical protein